MFQNQSPIQQTVIVTIRAGTHIDSTASAPPTLLDPIPTGPLYQHAMTSDSVRPAIVMAPYGANGIGITMAHGPGASQYFLHDASHIFGNSSLPANEAAVAPAVCISLLTELYLRVEVLEDRGAVTGMATTLIHRNAGYTDYAMTPPQTFHINGGRPF